MARASAGRRRAGASLGPSAKRCPTHAGREQCGNGQDDQKLSGNAHGLSLKSPKAHCNRFRAEKFTLAPSSILPVQWVSQAEALLTKDSSRHAA
jgi:hypothetical protein